MKLRYMASILLSISLSLGASHLMAGEILKEDSEAFIAWASKNEKSLLVDDGVRIKRKSIPEGFTEAKVSDRDIDDRNVVYYDPVSHRFYYDKDTITFHSDDRASVMTHRTYAKLKQNKTVVVLGNKAIYHRSVRIKIKKANKS
jgi:hypothetical protein